MKVELWVNPDLIIKRVEDVVTDDERVREEHDAKLAKLRSSIIRSANQEAEERILEMASAPMREQAKSNKLVLDILKDAAAKHELDGTPFLVKVTIDI